MNFERALSRFVITYCYYNGEEDRLKHQKQIFTYIETHQTLEKWKRRRRK